MTDIYGEWTVLGEGQKKGKFRHLQCRCSCGVIRDVNIYSLRSGGSTGCGDKRRHKAHLIEAVTERNAWRHMHDRCTNPSNKSFQHYGHRGISVCDRWGEFENFLSDMGRRPSEQHSLDRIDTNGDYTPSNCRWATIKEQNRNTRGCRKVRRSDGAVFGSVAEAAEASGVTADAIRSSIRRTRQTAGHFWEYSN